MGLYHRTFYEAKRRSDLRTLDVRWVIGVPCIRCESLPAPTIYPTCVLVSLFCAGRWKEYLTGPEKAGWRIDIPSKLFCIVNNCPGGCDEKVSMQAKVYPTPSVCSSSLSMLSISLGSLSPHTPPPFTPSAPLIPTSFPTKFRPTLPGPIPIHLLTPYT